ncbi:hypothetical protein ACO0RG_001500 [Hanseniaspora osmophila]
MSNNSGEDIPSINHELDYSRHILRCLIKFLPNNPNFCNSYKNIEEEEYFKKCKISLLYYSINNNINVLIEDIIVFLEERLLKFEEFSTNYVSLTNERIMNYQDYDSNELDNDNASANTSNTANTHTTTFTINVPSTDTSPHGNERTLPRYRTCKKNTKYPIKSIGISNYILVFLRLLSDICEVNYAYYETPFYKKLSLSEKKQHFDKYFCYSLQKDEKFFKVLIFGIIQNQHFPPLNENDINKTSRHAPKKLDPRLFKKILKFLIPLKSTYKLETCIKKIINNDKTLLPIIKNELLDGSLTKMQQQAKLNAKIPSSSLFSPANQNQNQNPSSTYSSGNDKQQPFNDSEEEHWDKIIGIKELRDQIDTNIEYLLHYIAASNSKDYYHFLEQILVSPAQLEAHFPSSARVVGNNYTTVYRTGKASKFHEENETKKNQNHNHHQQTQNDHDGATEDIRSIKSSDSFHTTTTNNNNNEYSAHSTSNKTSSTSEKKPFALPSSLNIYNSELLYATEYLSFVVFKSTSDMTNYIKLLIKLLGMAKKPIFKKCCLFAFTHCLELWTISKPVDYNKFTHENTTSDNVLLNKEITQLFNLVYSTFNASQLMSNAYGNNYINSPSTTYPGPTPPSTTTSSAVPSPSTPHPQQQQLYHTQTADPQHQPGFSSPVESHLPGHSASFSATTSPFATEAQRAGAPSFSGRVLSSMGRTMSPANTIATQSTYSSSGNSLYASQAIQNLHAASAVPAAQNTVPPASSLYTSLHFQATTPTSTPSSTSLDSAGAAQTAAGTTAEHTAGHKDAHLNSPTFNHNMSADVEHHHNYETQLDSRDSSNDTNYFTKSFTSPSTSSKDSFEAANIEEYSNNLMKYISKFLTIDEPTVTSKLAGTYTLGYCFLDSNLVDPGDVGILRALVTLSILHVDVFRSFLNKTSFKNFYDANDISNEPLDLSPVTTPLSEASLSSILINSPPPLTTSKSTPSPPIFSPAGTTEYKMPSLDTRVTMSSTNISKGSKRSRANSRLAPLIGLGSPSSSPPSTDAHPVSSTSAAPSVASSSSGSFLQLQTPIPTKHFSVGSQKLQQNLKKMTSSLLPSSYSTNKEVRFWSNLMKYLTISNTSSHQITDKSMILILNSVMFLYSTASIISIVSPSSPIVIFAKRLYFNLIKIFDYSPQSPLPENLTLLYSVLKRNPTIQTKFNIEFMTPSIYLQGDKFIDLIKTRFITISEKGVYKKLCAYNLYCMTEGMKFFFQVPFEFKSRAVYFTKMLRVIRELGFQLSTNLLQTIDFIDENASQAVDMFLQGQPTSTDERIDFYVGKKLVDTERFFKIDPTKTETFSVLDEKSFAAILSLTKKDLKGWMTNSKNKEHLVHYNAKPLSKYDTSVTSDITIAILCNIVNYFKTATSLFEEGVLTTKNQAQPQYLQKTLFTGLLCGNKKLVKETIACIETSFSLAHIDSSDERFATFYSMTGHSCLGLSIGAFNLYAPDSTRLLLLKTLVQFLEQRAVLNEQLYQKTKFQNLDEDDRKIFEQLHESLGRTSYLSLCLHDVKAHAIIRELFSMYQKEIYYYGKYIGKNLADMHITNTEFTAAMANCTTVYGPIAFQRHIRADILKLIHFPNKKLFDACTLIFEEWFQMGVIGSENLSSHEQNKFRNYSGLLAATSGIFNFRNSELLGKFPYLTYAKNLITKEIDYTIRRHCELLDSPDLLTRENAKDVLSLELNSVHFDNLFDNLLKKLECVFVQKDGQNVENFTLLEQIILVMRSLMERDDIKVIIVTTAKVLKIVSKILELVEKLPKESVNQYKAMIYTSKLFLSFKHSEKFMFLKGDHMLKNSWIRIVLNWFGNSVFKEMDYINLTKPHREMDLARRDIDYLYLDTSIDCAKALAYLTTRVVLEVPQAANEEDYKRSKSVLFGNYFSILLKALEKTADYESIPFVLRHKVLIFNENVIICLKNLLNANSDVGLNFALPMGYSKNRMIRLTFLKVFVDISKNVRMNSAELNASQEEKINEVLQRMVTHPELLCLIASCCPVNEVESLSTFLVSIFHSKSLSHILISYLIIDEIENSTRSMDILRRNSIATRTLAMFSRICGHEYLKKTIKPVLDSIIASDEDFEIEKSLPSQESAEINVERFGKYMVKLTDSICSSVNDIPPEFIYISQRIREAAKKKFPGSELVAVGSFIFLRFFCPALVSPDTENLIPSLLTGNRRSFILLAKVIQNIANQSVKSLKWPLIQDKMDLLETCSNRIMEYLANISDPNIKTDIPIHYDAPIGKQNNLGTFHKILYNHKQEMRNIMVKSVSSDQSLEDLLDTARIVDEALLSLGQPRVEFKDEIPSFIKENVDKYSVLYEFLSRYYLKQQNQPEEAQFAHEAIDREGNPMLVYSMKTIGESTLDNEQVIYKLILLASRFWSKQHIVLFDCTGFPSVNLEKMKNIFSLYLNLLPKNVFLNHTKLILYNVNDAFMTFFMSMERHIFKHICPVSPAHEFLNSDCSPDIVNSLSLTKYSTDVYNDVRVTLHNTSLYEQQKGRFVPVTLKIGNKTFQIVKESPKRMKLAGLEKVYEVYYNDVYEIRDILSAGTSSVTGIPFEFTLQLKTDNTLIMSTQKYLEVLKIFYYAQTKLDEESMNLGYQVSKESVISKSADSDLDILARALFVTFAGLSSCDDEIKSTSYALLSVIQQSFELDLGQRLHNLPEVFLPDDNDIFTQVLFENLARTKPELTYYIWNHFLEGINNVLDDSQIVHCINCLSPWTSNIYSHIYRADKVLGSEKCALIIRSLIKVSIRKTRFANAFKYFVWSDLILDSSLLGMITDEIVNHAIDRESEGSDWTSCISILTRISSVEITGQIIQRLLKLIKKFIPTLGSEQNINNWSEIFILISVLQDLSFNTSMNFEICLPEILYIVSMLIDLGPSKLRVSLHRLLVNVCSTFIINSSEGSENIKRLTEVIEPLSSQKTKVLFGFQQEAEFAHNYTNGTTLLSKLTSLNQLVNYMTCIIRYGSETASYSTQWQAKYNDLLIETIFGDSYFLSSRAMTIFSIISRDGISDELIYKLLTGTMQVLGEPNVTEEGMIYLISHMVSYANFIQGIKTNTSLMAQLYWFSFSYLYSPSVILFHAGLLTNLVAFEKVFDVLTDKQTVANYLWENNRHGLNETLISIEHLQDIECTQQNLIHLTIHFLAKGALVLHTKATAMSGFKTFFKIVQNNERLSQEKKHMGFLLFLYFSLPSAEFYDFCESVNLPSEKTKLDDLCEAPKVLVDWLLDRDDDYKKVVLYQASHYASSEHFEDSDKLKVFSIALYVAKHKPKLFFKYMSKTIFDARRIEKQGILLELLRKAFDISNFAIMHERYPNVARYEREVSEKMKHLKMSGIKTMTFGSTSPHVLAGVVEESDQVFERKKLSVTLVDEIINT